MSRPPRMPDEDDGVARDAWLSEALRHAPDADAVPPSALSETILRQARAAASPASVTSASFGQRCLAVWSWLARPPVAAGFASVMVATVVGLMWWDRPLEETLPPRQAPVAAAPPPPAPVAAPAPAPATLPPAPAAAIDTRRQTTAEVDRPTREQPVVQQAPRSQATAPTQMADAKGAAGPAAKRAAEPPPSMTETPRAAASEQSGAAVGAMADTEAAASERRLRSVAAAAKTEAPVDAAPAPAARAPLAAQALRRDAASVGTPIGALRAVIATQPERWRWQRADGAPLPLTDGLVQWLSQLDTATSSRWQPDRVGEAVAAGRGETASDAAAPLQLWLDGRLHSTLRVDAAGVVVEAAGDPSSRQRAELPAAGVAALRAALDRATR